MRSRACAVKHAVFNRYPECKNLAGRALFIYPTKLTVGRGKYNEVFAHHNAEEYLDAYIEAAGIWEEKKAPLFRTIDRKLKLSDRELHRTDSPDIRK